MPWTNTREAFRRRFAGTTIRGSIFEAMLAVAVANFMFTWLLMLVSGSPSMLHELGDAALRAEGIVGTTIFSVVGALAAGPRLKKWRTDNWMFTFASCFLTANGGGTLRDALLGVLPFWFHAPEFVVIPLIVSASAFAVRANKLPLVDQLLRMSDDFASGIFVLIGIMKVAAVLDAGHPLFVFAAVLMGTMTGVGGGMLRDIFLLRRVPTAFVCNTFVNAFLCGYICSVWLAAPPVDIGVWIWFLAGTAMLVMNVATAGRTLGVRSARTS